MKKSKVGRKNVRLARGSKGIDYKNKWKTGKVLYNAELDLLVLVAEVYPAYDWAFLLDGERLIWTQLVPPGSTDCTFYEVVGTL